VTARLRSPALLLAALFAFALPPASRPAFAASALNPITAHVIWAGGSRVYLESDDPRARVPGTTLTFVLRGRAIAAAQIERADEGGLIVVALKSGSLAGVRKLSELGVFASPVAMLGRPSLVVGLPDPERASLALRCGTAALALPPGAGYEAVDASRSTARFVRQPGSSSGGAWPETLTVRYFEESTDQEIALERGEIDVAVFWPGELSVVMRRDPRWSDPLVGIRRHGTIAATVVGAPRRGGGLPDSTLWQALDDELFRGDLVLASGARSASRRAPERPRFEVDASLPGSAAIERFLNGPSPAAADPNVTRVQLWYEASSTGSNVVDLSAGHGEAARDAEGGTTVFALGCPVVCAVGMRAYVQALGVSVFANLCTCDSGSRHK
jgi:hypothetical protein